MAYRIHFSSGESGLIPGAGISLEEQARRHAAQLHAPLEGRPGEFNYALEVYAVRDVVDHLEGIRRAGGSVAFMDFHVHGRSGEISLGREALFSWRRHFGGLGLESTFARDARIEFHGCNVAEGGDGEAFLADCAWTLLRVNGGSVSGSAWYEFAIPYGADNLSPGRLVVARIGAGGHVQLQGARHLIPGRLRRRLASLTASYERIRDEHRPGLHDDLERIGSLLHNAEPLLAGRPSYSALRTALAKLDSAEGYLIRLDPGLAVPPTFGW